VNVVLFVKTLVIFCLSVLNIIIRAEYCLDELMWYKGISIDTFIFGDQVLIKI